MPWLKSDDKFPRNDKVWELSDAAYRLYDAARHYAAEKMTDGWVPTSRITSLTPRPAKRAHVDELLSAGLLHRASETCRSCLEQRKAKKVTEPLPKGGYMVHHYLDYNYPRWKILAERDSRVRAGAAGGLARAQALAIANAQADAVAPAQAHAQAKDLPRTPETQAHAQARTPYPVAPVVSIETTTRTRGELRPLGGAVSRFVASAERRVVS